MRLPRALRPGLIRPEVLARQPLLSRPISRASVLQSDKKAYSVYDIRYPWPEKNSPNNYDKNFTLLLDSLKVDLPDRWRLTWPHVRRRNKFPYLWLRDNCRCPECVNPDTMQRKLQTFELPRDIHATKVKADHARISITWEDGHESLYDWEFMQNYVYHDRRSQKEAQSLWYGSMERRPHEEFELVMMSEERVASLAQKIIRFGFCFVDNAPYDDPNDTKELLERLGIIRQTHYGGFYDFKPDLAMADTAYTTQALAPHTDTTYFTEPAGLQAFHMLSHEPDENGECSGGQSILVDGFNVARILKEQDPRAYEILSQVRLPWHASGNKGIAICPDEHYPVLDHMGGPALHRIRWNMDDRGVVPFTSPHQPVAWYKAARKFDSLLNREGMHRRFPLTPGTVLIFDNWRVLHGREAFKGIRRMCGAYITRDDFMSRYRNTSMELADVFRKVTG